MRKLLLIAGAAALGLAAPAAAKNNKHGHGGHAGHANAGGCPPGLAKKGNGCLPPGQAKKLGVGDRYAYPTDRYYVPDRYRDRYSDNGESLYRYRDGNVYEIDRDSGLITEIIRLLGV